MVQDEGEIIEITNRGEVVARLVPAQKPLLLDEEDDTNFWTDIDNLAAEIAAYLPEKVDAVEMLRDATRDL